MIALPKADQSEKFKILWMAELKYSKSPQYYIQWYNIMQKVVIFLYLACSEIYCNTSLQRITLQHTSLQRIYKRLVCLYVIAKNI